MGTWRVAQAAMESVVVGWGPGWFRYRFFMFVVISYHFVLALARLCLEDCRPIPSTLHVVALSSS